MPKPRRRTHSELLQLVEDLKKRGVTSFKDGDLELQLMPLAVARATFPLPAPPANETPEARKLRLQAEHEETLLWSAH